jgi:TIR domain
MTVCEEILARIIPKLETLPSVNELNERNNSGKPPLREDSWMTADQICRFLEAECAIQTTVSQIEDCLFDYEKSPSRSIRSAKYPHTSQLVRLWGHVKNVDEGSPHLVHARSDPPSPISGIESFVEGPRVFISYASPDRTLAVEIARKLSKMRVTAWLYELAINQDDLIIESVGAALRRCDALLALITPFSIASLWVRTESTTATVYSVPVYLAIPTNDLNLVRLLAHGDDWVQRADLIRPLEATYRQCGTATRIEKYPATLHGFLPILLQYARARPIVVIGPEPPEWRGMFKVTDLSGFGSELHPGHTGNHAPAWQLVNRQ